MIHNAKCGLQPEGFFYLVSRLHPELKKHIFFPENDLYTRESNSCIREEQIMCLNLESYLNLLANFLAFSYVLEQVELNFNCIQK